MCITSTLLRALQKWGLTMRMKLIAGVVLAAVASTALPAAAGSPSPEVGTAAPPLQLAAGDGSSRSLAAIDGPRVLIFYRGLW